MEWIDRLRPPFLAHALDRLGLQPEDRRELEARWLDALGNSDRLEELSCLYDRYFMQREDPAGCDPIDAALLALLQLPVLEAVYRELKIPEAVLNATLSDVGRWMAQCRRVKGRFGLEEFPWVIHALCLELVQLGSLHFMPGKGDVPAHAFSGPRGIILLAEEGVAYREDGWGARAKGLPECPTFTARYREGTGFFAGHLLDGAGRCAPQSILLPKRFYRPLYHPGDAVVEVHIPEGADLSPEAVEDAFRRALAYDKAPFLGKTRVFTCHSWLLSPQLPGLVPGSRLAAFSARWRRVAREEASDAQTWERAFDFRPVDRADPPTDTRLRRALSVSPVPVLGSAGLLFAQDILPEGKHDDP